MSIIIDTNCFHKIFKYDSKDVCDDFAPLYKWIFTEKNKIVYGGKTYDKELKKDNKALGVVNQLKSANQVIKLKNDLVNRKEIFIKSANGCKKSDFDDQHIVAIIIISKCMLISTDDTGLIKFLHSGKLRRLFKTKRPKIYSKKSNYTILNKKNIAKIPKDVIEN